MIMQRLFVTGASGFIGKNFINAALQKDFKIIDIRRNNSFTEPNQDSKIEWIDCDLLDLNEKMLTSSDMVIHLASEGVSPKEVEFKDMIMSNVNGTSHLMECAVKAKIKRIIMVGTCHEYGNNSNDGKPIKADSKLDPISFYASSKAASYFLTLSQCRKYNFEMFYGRIFSVYGDGQYKKNFWPSLKRAALNGENFPMTSGEQIRDFIHVDEVSKELIRACERNDLIPGKAIVKNIASGKPMKLIDFAKNEWEKFQAKGDLLPGSIQSRLDESVFLYPDLQEKIL